MEKKQRNKWIVQAHREGMTVSDIAYECGITASRVSYILHRDKTKHAPYEEKRALRIWKRRMESF